MKRTISLLLALTLLAIWAFPVLAAPSACYCYYPYFFIASVVADEEVTITPYQFAANDTYTVRMGAYGTLGIGGIVVDTVTTNSSGVLSKTTFSVPDALAGSYRIAIRLESSLTGYYAYNWFYNNTTGSTVTPVPWDGYVGYPYFFITAVTRDTSVKINPYNFPANNTFNIRMGAYGTLGVGGILVGTVTTDEDGVLSDLIYEIPAALAGSYKIAIRLESTTSPYYAYNWFYNNTTTSDSEPIG